MGIANTFEQAESEVRRLMKLAIDAGDFSKLQSLLALQRLCADGRQISGRLEEKASAGTARAGVGVDTNDRADAHTVGSAPSKKARSLGARRSWILAYKVPLRHVKNRLYRTPSGSSVGVAYASENENKRPDKWWLGLPDEQYDVVVLLCEDGDGTILDFVLPRDFLLRFWSGLTRSGGQVEFHVERSGATYNFRTAGGWVPITSYLGNHSILY